MTDLRDLTANDLAGMGRRASDDHAPLPRSPRATLEHYAAEAALARVLRDAAEPLEEDS